MPYDVKVNNPREVAEHIRAISLLLEEYKSNCSADCDSIVSVDQLIDNTNSSLGTKRYEAERLKSHAKSMEKESEQAQRIVVECEKKIANCDRQLANMRKCKEELYAAYSQYNGISKMIEEAVNSHKSLETRITMLLEKIETAF